MKRQIEEQVYKNQLMKQKYRLIITLVKMKAFVNIIAEYYNERKAYLIWLYRSRVLGRKLLRKSEYLWHRRAADRDQRSRIFIRHALTHRANMLLTNHLTSSPHQLVYAAISKGSITTSFVHCLRDTLAQVIFIQQKFKNVMLILKSRTQALKTSILNQQQFLTVSALLGKANKMIAKKQPAGGEGAKQLKDVAGKLQRLSDERKEFVAECFIALAKLDFRWRFLAWYRETRVSVDTEEGRLKAEEVDASMDQARSMTRRLMAFVVCSSALALPQQTRADAHAHVDGFECKDSKSKPR